MTNTSAKKRFAAQNPSSGVNAPRINELERTDYIMSNIKISPSILAANAAKLGEEVKKAYDAGAEYLHLDIMDGHFVPNLSFSSNIVKTLKEYSGSVFDVHLMLSEPKKYIESFVDAGADIITVHYEAVNDLKEIADIIHGYNIKAGISVKPNTEFDKVKNYLKYFDMLLIMTVEPGFGGQSYIKEMNSKIRQAKEFITANNLSCDIEIDGGVTLDNVGEAAKCGANIIVAGSAIFKAENPADVIIKMKEACKQ